MADCRQHYPFFSQQLSQAYQAVSENQADLESIYQQLREETRSFVIVLHRLDAMGKTDVDQRFDRSFYGRLNSLRNLPNVHLLTIAPERLEHDKGMLFYIEGQMLTSLLNINENRRLPQLSHDELKYELQQRGLALSPTQAAQVLDCSKIGPVYCYEVFDYLCQRLENETFPSEIALFRRLLKRWRGENKVSWERRVQDQKMSGARWLSIFGIKSLFEKILEILKIIYADWMMPIGNAIGKYIESWGNKKKDKQDN
jgi:hypothetical protein